MIGTCGSAGCIDAATVAQIVAIFAGAWAGGFGVGKVVAYIRAIRTFA